MQVVMNETVEEMRVSSEEDIQHPVRDDGLVIEPMSTGEGRDGHFRQYRLVKDTVYTVPDDMGANLVALDFAEEA